MPSPERGRSAVALPVVFGLLVLVVLGALAVTLLGGGPSQASPGTTPDSSASTAAQITPSASPSPTETPTEAPTPTPTIVPVPSNPPTVTSATITAKDPAGTWKVSFRYPRLLPATTPLADAIDADIKSEIETGIEEFEQGPAAVPHSGPANSLTGTYTVTLTTNRLVSLKIKSVEDTNGAHPATTVTTLTYDLANGTRVSFGDLFADPPGALAILTDQARTRLKDLLGAGYDPAVAEDGTTPDVQNFGAWALTPTGFQVTFAEYQVGAGAVGLPVIEVPWSELTSVIDPAGPIAAFAKS